MNLHPAALCLLATLCVAAPLSAAERYTAGHFQLELDGEDAGWVRSTYARHSGGQAIDTDQLKSYLQHMQADGWDRARVEQDIIASRPRQAIPAQPNMRVRCTGKPLRCESVPAPVAKEQAAPKP